MKKRIMIWSIVYYLLIPCIFLGGWLLLELLPSDENPSLGATGGAIMTMLFVITPVIFYVLTRFSLLKWYVDPFAAAEVPLCLYIWMIFTEMNRWDVSFGKAFANVNESLSRSSIGGWKMLAVLFVLGLVASFSITRKKGESAGYWWITPLEPKAE